MMVSIILIILQVIAGGLIAGFLMILANTWMYDSTWRKVYADNLDNLKIIDEVRKESYVACCWIAAAAVSIVILILMVKLYADAIPGMVERMFL